MNKNKTIQSKKRKLSLKERTDSEFKHLRLRIEKLEEIVLRKNIDHGLISDEPTFDKKG